jgi:hypothetical protein
LARCDFPDNCVRDGGRRKIALSAPRVNSFRRERLTFINARCDDAI